MIAHHGEAQHVDSELAGQLFQAALNPLLAVLEGPAAGGVGAAQVGPPHATIDAVIHADVTGIEHILSPQPRHGRFLERRESTTTRPA